MQVSQQTPIRAADATQVRDVRVLRQGMYDGVHLLRAYALLVSGEAGEVDSDQVVSSILRTFDLAELSDGRPVFLPATRSLLTGAVPVPDGTVLALTDRQAADPALLAELTGRRAAGHQIAVDWTGEADGDAWLGLADYLLVDAEEPPTPELDRLLAGAVAAGAVLVAHGVRTEAVFRRHVERGFGLFQGPFLQRGTMFEQRTLSPSHLVCVRLLGELADAEVPAARLSELVGSDPGLAVRVLRQVNSAASRGAGTISSLQVAVVLLGTSRLRSLVVANLLDGDTADSSAEDLWMALARAGACRRLAEEDDETGYLVGLLSGTADLLRCPPAAVAAAAGVGPAVAAALVDHDGPAGTALSAVLAHESGEPDTSGLDAYDVSRAYLDALSTSLSTVHDLAR